MLSVSLLSVGLHETSVDRHAEFTYGTAGRRISDLRVPCEVSHKQYFIQRCHIEGHSFP